MERSFGANLKGDGLAQLKADAIAPHFGLVEAHTASFTRNLLEALTRKKEIRYSSRIHAGNSGTPSASPSHLTV
jgi:hypothetical protein